MCIPGKKIYRLIHKLFIVAAIFCVATFCYAKVGNSICLAYDDEAAYSVADRDYIEVPDDIDWKDRVISENNENGHVKYVLKNRMLKIYIDKKLVWQTDRDYFVQDVFVADIDNEELKQNPRNNKRSKDEIVMLLWKKGRYGIYRPFWVHKDEESFSQHLFVYNLSEDKAIPRWGSSYMGEEVKDMCFKDDLLFLTHNDNRETAWRWRGFGFEKNENVDFFIVGDNLLHEPIYKDAINNHNGDFDHIYKKVEIYTKNADISIINLETPLVKDPKRYSTYPCFGSPVSVAKSLKKAGFDGVTLSNNHRLDKGETGIIETIEALDKNDLLHVGSMDEKPYLLIKRNDIVFALLNYTYGTNGIKPKKGYENAVNYLEDEEKIREDIREAKDNADFVIVFPHWGTEYAKEPNSYQKKWRDIFYEEGVDVVCGTHPHVIQPFEMYKAEDCEREMLIYYSLGNYISANGRAEHNSGGYAVFSVEATSKGPKIVGYRFVKSETMFKASNY